MQVLSRSIRVAPPERTKTRITAGGLLVVRQLLAVLLGCAWICTAANVIPPVPASEERIIQGVDRAEQDRETGLAGYSVTEHYILHNSRFQARAEMTVATIYRKGVGKTYQVISRSGSPMLQSSVLDKLLKEQAELSRGEARRQAVVTSANYKMKVVGEELLDGRPCKVLELIPRKKSSHVVTGRAWVDSEDQALVRIEGTPAATLSFWAGRPKVVRQYEEIGRFSFAKESHASSESFFLGKSDLMIEYSDYTVDATQE